MCMALVKLGSTSLFWIYPFLDPTLNRFLRTSLLIYIIKIIHVSTSTSFVLPLLYYIKKYLSNNNKKSFYKNCTKVSDYCVPSIHIRKTYKKIMEKER